MRRDEEDENTTPAGRACGETQRGAPGANPIAPPPIGSLAHGALLRALGADPFGMLLRGAPAGASAGTKRGAPWSQSSPTLPLSQLPRLAIRANMAVDAMVAAVRR
jgi:hypothetical protein